MFSINIFFAQRKDTGLNNDDSDFCNNDSFTLDII